MFRSQKEILIAVNAFKFETVSDLTNLLQRFPPPVTDAFRNMLVGKLKNRNFVQIRDVLRIIVCCLCDSNFYENWLKNQNVASVDVSDRIKMLTLWMANALPS